MTSNYDQALTVFSPDGHLFQVEYAMKAVEKGATVVGVRGAECVILGVEKKATAKLQDPRTVRKTANLDQHMCLAFAGLTADARVLVEKARIECQSFRLTCEDAPTVEYIARFLARIQQKYTQKGGVRPFGISGLLAGFNPNEDAPQLYRTDPSGTFNAWKADAVGNKSKNVREFLENHYEEGLNDEATLKLVVQALLEVVQSGAKTMELVILKSGQPITTIPTEDVEAVVQLIEAEQAEGKTEES